MKGIINEINLKRGMVSVKTETEGFSIFEIKSDDNLHVGDVVGWDEEHPLGDCIVKNSITGEEAEVYFQNHWLKPEDLHKQLLY